MFTANREHTVRLLDAADAKETVTVTTKIVMREPDDKFKGFFFFGKKGEKPKAYKWCFVIDQILDGSIPVQIGEAADTGPDFPKNAPPARQRKIPRSRAKAKRNGK